ncbi:holo-ACP synthase [Anaerobacterium chartisolvens]|nr:holo-ACP synthase [Anaerobacterium chartisolvens]
MVVGIGTDILKIERIRNALSDGYSAFLRKTFTLEEREQAALRPDPAMYFATRFAAKEAVFKTLGIDGSFVDLTEIEIINNEFGQPAVQLFGKLKQVAESKGVSSVMVSISYETEYVSAFAVAQR